MINMIWGFYWTLNNVYFIRKRSVCETGQCCWWHREDGWMMRKMGRGLTCVNANAFMHLSYTHCKSVCPWLQRLSLITFFRSDLNLMLLVQWWKVSSCSCRLWKNILTGLTIIVVKETAPWNKLRTETIFYNKTNSNSNRVFTHRFKNGLVTTALHCEWNLASQLCTSCRAWQIQQMQMQISSDAVRTTARWEPNTIILILMKTWSRE